MRYGFGFPSPSPNVTRFLIIIIASFLLFAIFGGTSIGFSLYKSLMLVPYYTVYKLEIWRIITYAFLHDISSPLHVIFNALVLYMIGTPLEERWGEKRFLIFSFIAIFLGGLFVSISFLLGLSGASVIGFSSVTVALVIAWGLTFPEYNIYIFGIFPITGKQLIWVTVGLEILYAVSSNSISSAAHFGGIATGFIMTLGLYKPKKIKRLLGRLLNKSNRS